MLKRFFIILMAFCVSANLLAQVQEVSVQDKIPELIKAYTKELYPRHDPFARIYNLEAGKKLFLKLSFRFCTETLIYYYTNYF